jgi:hypothetical protein
MKIFSPKRYVNTNRAFLRSKKLVKSMFYNKYFKKLQGVKPWKSKKNDKKSNNQEN